MNYVRLSLKGERKVVSSANTPLCFLDLACMHYHTLTPNQITLMEHRLTEQELAE